jgi:hypothetical protein
MVVAAAAAMGAVSSWISKIDMEVLQERPIFIMDSNNWIANFSTKRYFFS